MGIDTLSANPPTITKTLSPTSSSRGAVVGASNVIAFIWIDRAAREWTETVVSVLRLEGVREVYVASPDTEAPAKIGLNHQNLVFLEENSFNDAAAAVLRRGGDQYLFVVMPVVVSPDALALAIPLAADDPRIATISFLSNSAGYISFPHRNTPTPFGVDGHNHETLTRHLRTKGTKDGGLVPLPVSEGGAVLVNRSAWEVSGALDDQQSGNGSFALAEFSLRAARRGFNSFLDPSTFVTRPWDGVGAYSSVLEDRDFRHQLHSMHPSFPGAYDSERLSERSVLAESLDLARAKATGIRVLIDGSALGPKEMGTQLLIMELTKALVRHPSIQWVALAVPDPLSLPHYAQELRATDKVRLIPAAGLNFEGAPHVDIIHRPFQPSSPIPWDRWRAIAKRSVITIQDLIAYRNGAYFKDWEDWERYRNNFKRQIANADAVVSISHDVVTSIKEERMPVSDPHLFVIENGADARSKDQPQSVPDTILERGWASRSFLFVLGATYAHKNRDLALRVWARLRDKGFNHAIVLVGAAVPFGSTRNEEARVISTENHADVLALPEVTAEERNWLLQNSSLAVYLTAAEGFGQVPFEAALMGVPTLHVSFGPLRELIDDESVPKTYQLDDLVERAEALLTDPAVAHSSVRKVLGTLGRLNWDETARKTVDAYYEILGLTSKHSAN